MRKILIFFCVLFYSIEIFGNTSQTKPCILVSIAPYKFLVEKIVGETCQVYSIVTNHYDPHTYEPSPKQIEKVRQGELWFRIGETFETLCSKGLSCEQIDLTKNLDLLPKGCHKHATFDTHTWLSPKNLKLQVQEIVNTLSVKYPHNAQEYHAREAELLYTLDSLDQEISAITSSTKKRHILVSHPAFGYFCRDYGFHQIPIEKDNHMDPSPKEISHLLTNIQMHKLSSIVLLQYAGRRSSTMLAKRFQMEIVTLDPYEENVLCNLKTIATTFANL